MVTVITSTVISHIRVEKEKKKTVMTGGAKLWWRSGVRKKVSILDLTPAFHHHGVSQQIYLLYIRISS